MGAPWETPRLATAGGREGRPYGWYRRILPLALALAAAVGSAPRAALAADGVLRIVSVLDDDVTDWIAKGFTAKTGIRVVRPLGKRSSLEVFSYLEARRAAPQVSVVLGGPSTAWARFAASGSLASYDSPELGAYPTLEDPQKRWFGIYRGTIAFASGSDTTVAPFTSWAELAKSEGPAPRVALANPATSGTAFTVLTSLVELMGEDAAFRYLSELDERVVDYPPGGAAAVRLVTDGVASVAIAFDHDIQRDIRRGARLAISYPAEGTGYEIGAVGILDRAPEPEPARAFVDHLLSLDFQSSLTTSDLAFYEPLRPGLPLQSWRNTLPVPHREAMDPAEAARRESDLLLRWNRDVISHRAHAASAGVARGGGLAKRVPRGFEGNARSLWVQVAVVALAVGAYAALSRRMTLLPRFLALVLLSVVVTALGIDHFSVRFQREAIEQRRQAQVRTATELLAEEVGADLVQRNFAALADHVEKLFRYFPGEVARVEIRDAAGALVARAAWRGDPASGKVEWIERGARTFDVTGGEPWTGRRPEAQLSSVVDTDTGRSRLAFTAPLVAYQALRGEVAVEFERGTADPAAVASGSNVLWVALAVSSIGALALSFFVSREIAGPLERLRERMARLGEGELTAPPPPRDARRRDEVAALGQSFATMVEGLNRQMAGARELVVELDRRAATIAHDAGEELRGAEQQRLAGDSALGALATGESLASGTRARLGELSRHVQETREQLDGIALAGRGLGASVVVLEQAVATAAAAAVEIAGATTRASRDVDAMLGYTRDTSDSVGILVSVACDVVERAREGLETVRAARRDVEQSRKLVQSALDGMTHLAQTVSDFVTASRELDASSQQAGQMIKVIAELSEEAGVLALNGSILAAQAGEHGRGFGVVAEEMRDLAARVEDATREVDTVVGAISGRVDRAVSAASESQRTVARAMGMADQADIALERIDQGTRAAATTVEVIASRTTDQDRRGRLVLQVVHELQQRVDSVSSEAVEQGRGTERVRSAIANVGGAVRELAEASRQLAQRTTAVQDRLDLLAGQHVGVLETGAEQSDALARLREQLEAGGALATAELERARAMLATADALRAGIDGLHQRLARLSVLPEAGEGARES